jgi:hypothetical protein
MLDDRVMLPFSLHQLTVAAHLELQLHKQEEDHPRQVHLLPIQDHLDVNLQVEVQVVMEVEDQVEEVPDLSVPYVEERIKIEIAPIAYKYQSQFADIVLDNMLRMHAQR